MPQNEHVTRKSKNGKEEVLERQGVIERKQKERESVVLLRD